MPRSPACALMALPFRLCAVTVIGAVCTALPAWAQTSLTTPSPAAVQMDVSSIDTTGTSRPPSALIEAVAAPFKVRRSLEELRAEARTMQRLFASEGLGAALAPLLISTNLANPIHEPC